MTGILTRSKQWVAGTLMTLGAAGLTGCTRPLYMTPETQHLANTVGLPADLATNPNADALPDLSDHKAPPTVLDAAREPRYMTLQEAMAIALERGSRGNASSFLFQNFNLGSSGLQSGFSGSYNDDLVQFAGRGVQGDDAIRAFALDPAIVASDIEGALSKFDARLTTSMSWQKRDQAVANAFTNFNNGDFAAFSSGLIKPLPTGGVANITVETNYSKLPQGFGVINPSYTPSVTVGFEQPLWRDYGVDVNQLLAQHPGSTQLGNYRPSGGRAEGILVTRIRADQAKADFEREVQYLVFNVELAYWSLYGRYYTKYASEQALRQAYVTYEQLQQLQVAGLQTKQAVAQARSQFEEFRLQYLVALQNVLEGERRLRGILGLQLEDGKRIVPADTPILAPYKPEWQSSLTEALANRPELRLARHELKVQQLNVMLNQNNVRPDLRVFGNYGVNSLGSRLDGGGVADDVQGNQTNLPANALEGLTDNRFGSWNLGVRFDVPLGNRDAHAQLKVAQLNLARSHVVLKNQERKAEFFLGSLWQQLAAYHEQIKLQQGRRVALGVALSGQFERVKIGKDPLIQLLDAQRNFTGSIQSESDAIVSYNVAIAGFHLAKGTILGYNGITLGEGPLPAAISERAADHFAARTAALKLRERPAPTGLPAEGYPTAVVGLADGPPVPEATAEPKVLDEKERIPAAMPKMEEKAPASPPKEAPKVVPPKVGMATPYLPPSTPDVPATPVGTPYNPAFRPAAQLKPTPAPAAGPDLAPKPTAPALPPTPPPPLARVEMPSTPVSTFRPQ